MWGGSALFRKHYSCVVVSNITNENIFTDLLVVAKENVYNFGLKVMGRVNSLALPVVPYMVCRMFVNTRLTKVTHFQHRQYAT